MTLQRPTRGELLTDLADAINELTRPTQHVEMLEGSVTRTTSTRNGKIRAKRTRERRKHTTTLPPLLDELQRAAVPGGGVEAGSMGASFESRPAAELDPVSVLREIADDLGFWMRTFAIEDTRGDRPDLASLLPLLVSAPADDAQLERITEQAARWVRRARIATGRDLPPITLNAPCPYCFRRHALVITADLQRAKCTRCRTTWSPDTIGLLAEMITANESQETAVDVRCWMADCVRRGPHDVHADGRGREWRREDRCIDESGTPISWTG